LNGYADRALEKLVGWKLMNQRNRLALLAAAALVLIVSGTVFATRAPSAPAEPTQLAQDGEEAPPTAEELAHAADRLRASGIGVDDPGLEAQLSELASVYGLGGAVRIIAWAAENALDATIDQIRERRDTGGPDGGPLGWGKIAKELGVHPGIGSIMGNGGGHGRENAPGQQNRGTGEGDASGE
jgi:hypothetical protein